MPLLEKDGTQASCPSYHPNDRLAEMIAQAWIDSGYRDRLLHDTANVFREAGIFVHNPVVVTEGDFATTNFAKDQQMVFVLPDAPSAQHFATSAMQGNLIETARVKMAYTSCGI
jgi:hypothetical protein